MRFDRENDVASRGRDAAKKHAFAPGKTTLTESMEASPVARPGGSVFGAPAVDDDMAAAFEPTSPDDDIDDADDGDQQADIEGEESDESEEVQARDADDLETDASAVEEEGAEDEPKDELPVDEASGGELPHREPMERMFGRLDGVKAHTGVDLSSLGAQAAARGNTVAFADKNPRSEDVAHEIAHVMQYRNAGGKTNGSGIAPEDSAAEREASHVESQVAAGAPVNINAAPAGGIHLKRNKGRYAKTDRYNREQTEGRPKVKLGKKGQWKLTADTTRYSTQDGTTARVFDTVPGGTTMQVNVAPPRKLTLGDGTQVECVLARSRFSGAAWTPVAALNADATKLTNAARKSAKKLVAAKPRGKLSAWLFRDSTRAGNYALTSNRDSQNKAQYDHYLRRETTRVKSGFFNVVMALPQPGIVPTAVDVAVPKDVFFVMRTRAVALYKMRGSAKVAKMSKWAFGCLGKKDANGKWTPDKSRRGWVPVDAIRRGKP